MKRFLSLALFRVNFNSQTRLLFFFGIVLLWLFIAAQVHQFLNDKLYIGLKEVIFSRVWLAALFFSGRYLFFPKVRLKRLLKWASILIFFLIIGAQIFRVVALKVHWLYYFLFLIDIAATGFFLAGLVEVIGGVFRQWHLFSDDAPKNIYENWQCFWRDALKLGFVLTLLMSLGYYYLINFYLVDTVLYSYILLAPVVGGGGALFAVAFTRMRDLFQKRINMIDIKLAPFFLREDHEMSEIAAFLPRYQFLLLTRSYLNELKKPFISVKTIFCYLLFICFMLILPYLLGAVVQV